MKRYSVEITPSAEADIINSFIWGCEAWGTEAAVSWANELRARVLKNLSASPLKYAAAPERDGSGREYRQMIAGRYRVIFLVDGNVVFCRPRYRIVYRS